MFSSILRGALVVTMVLAPNAASAQGCVAARLDCGTVRASDGSSSKWNLFTSWRHYKSDRHFVGSEEQVHRTEEGSQVINTFNGIDISVRYNYNARTSFTISLPYLIAERSGPIRDTDSARTVIDRSLTHANGIGDITLVARRWMLDPATHGSMNVSLGGGIKLPTGNPGLQDSRKTITGGTGGTVSTSFGPVDQSIQPGDGGFGFIVDLGLYKTFGMSGFTLYGSGSYLINPRETNTTYRGGTDSITQYMSVADQYVARVGVTYDKPKFGIGLGGRVDAVPSSDLVGGDRGFRRPGHSIAIDPSVRYSWGASNLNLSVPFAVARNRYKSYSDELRDRHGDAAFADFNIIVSYSRRL